MKTKIALVLLLAAASLTQLYAEDIKSSSDIQSQITRKIYPKPEHPPGYYQGILLIGFSQGNLFSPTGSFISHEKEYDQSIKSGIESGLYSNMFSGAGLPNFYFEPQYIPLVTRMFDIEYGVGEHFGLGFSNFRYQIDSIRQDVIYGSDKFGQIYYEPVPMRKTLFDGNAFLLLGTFHPFPRKTLDPYIIARGGIVKFSGNAHEGLFYDSHRTSSMITNGLGKAAGGGIGMNFFIVPQFGIKVEGNYTRSFLNSDQISGRILNTYNIQMGVFFNYSSIAATIGNDWQMNPN